MNPKYLDHLDECYLLSGKIVFEERGGWELRIEKC